jgi:hypothetical protein
MVLMKLPMGDTYSASIYARLYVYLFVYIRTWKANILANSNTVYWWSYFVGSTGT